MSLIDEWDCLFREYANNTDAQKKHLDFLHMWLKDQDYIALAYMTGILPIKKYGTHSALNIFWKYSMTDPGELAPFFGFTEDEVRELCEQYDMSFEEARAWYDGYELVGKSWRGIYYYDMYNPKVVVKAMSRHNFGSYWNQTETYEALKIYIHLNIDGLKDAVVKLYNKPCLLLREGILHNNPRIANRKRFCGHLLYPTPALHRQTGNCH